MVLPPVGHATTGISSPPHRSNIIVGEMTTGKEAMAQHWQNSGCVTFGPSKTKHPPPRATLDQAYLRNHQAPKSRGKSPTPVARHDHNDFTKLRLQALKRVFDQCDIDQSGDLNPQETTMGMDHSNPCLGVNPTRLGGA